MTTTTLTKPSEILVSTAPLSNTTEAILNFAFWLLEQKETLPRKEFKQLIQSYGWTKEQNKYIRLAEVFCLFSPSDLAAIEPDTLFVLAKHHKKYAPVIKQLQDLGTITQEKVKALMKEQRKPRVKTEEKPRQSAQVGKPAHAAGSTIWRSLPDGGRYVQIPPIHDEEAGVTLQEMMEQEGLTAQKIVAEGLCLRQALKVGQLTWVSSTQELEALMEETAVHESEKPVSTDIVNIITLVEQPESNCNSLTVNDVLSELSNKLFYVVENITRFTRKQVKEAEQLVREIVNFCNSQPADCQWLTLAEITRRDGMALSIVIGYLGREHKNWFLNLPQLLADAAIQHPEELLWVNEVLRSNALLITKLAY
jgi:hypothetical protein